MPVSLSHRFHLGILNARYNKPVPPSNALADDIASTVYNGVK
jgi:hypothetical protein